MTTLPAGVQTVPGFPTRDAAGAYALRTSGGLTGHGRGPDGTTLTLAPRTSNRKGLVPTGKGTTNPVYLAKVTGGDRPTHVTGLSIVGTPQGHLYNGLRIDRAAGKHAFVEVAEVRISGIPGDSDINPGETFLLNLYRCSNVHVHDVELDGAGIGASGLGLNTCSGPLHVEDVTAHDLKWCKGIALWKQADGGRIVGYQSLSNAFAFGFERCEGLYRLEQCKFRGSTRADIHLASDTSRAKIVVVDPDLGGRKLKVLLPPKEMGRKNRQTRDDLTIIVDGKPRPDLIQWVTRA